MTYQNADRLAEADQRVVSGAHSGFPGAAHILTMDGTKRVDQLRPGCRIITRDQGSAVLTGCNRVSLKTSVVAFRSIAVAGGSALLTTLLPADQLVLVRDWRAQAMFGQPQTLVRAERLVDGEFVVMRAPRKLTLFSLSFESSHIVYLDGLELAVPDTRQTGLRPAA